MNDAQKQLLKGALKSGVAAATGLIISLPIADPSTFSVKSVGGWEHIVFVIGVTVLVAEARFWNQWANSSDEAK